MTGILYTGLGVFAGVCAATGFAALAAHRIRTAIRVYRFRRALRRNPYLGEVARLEHKITRTQQNIRDCLGEGGES